MISVIFDLDGTLVDSVEAIRDIANTLLAELALPLMDTSEARANIGNGAIVFLEKTLRARDAVDATSFEPRLKRYQEIYAAAPGEANPPFAGVENVLQQLKADGARLGLCTNKPEAPTHGVIEALGWNGIFETVVAGDTLAERKPSPLPLRTVADRLGNGPVVYIGDSEVDAAAAEAAGLPFLLFTEGYRKSPVSALNCAGSFTTYDAGLLKLIRHTARVVGPS